MKKLFTFASLLFATMLLMTSCKDDEGRDPQEISKILVNYDWQGYQDAYKKQGSGWIDNGERTYNVLRFNGVGTNPQSGTGYLLQFENEFKNNEPEAVKISWRIEDGQITIEYDKTGWQGVYINFNDAEIYGDTFRGDMFDRYDHKYTFKFSKQTYSNWDKYFTK